MHETHHKMQTVLAAAGGGIDFIAYCPHAPEANCLCRKPKTGLLDQVAEHFDVSLNNVYMVGDKLSDIQAFQAVGGKAILVKTGEGKKTLYWRSHR